MITNEIKNPPHRPVSKNKPDPEDIRYEYEQKGMKQSDLSLKYRVSPRTIARWLKEAEARKR